MRVGVLGPLEVVVDGEVVPVGGGRLRTLLARLAVDVGRQVSVDELSDALWGGAAPADPANAVQSLVSRLRRLLPDAATVLRSGAGGYRLELPPAAVDTVRFERLARDGSRALAAGDPTTAAHLLGEALHLWRGRALDDLAHTAFGAAAAGRLEDLRLTASEDLVDTHLAAGRYAVAVAELTGLTTAHPLRERSRGQLVQALHAAGRQAEALAAYEEYRHVLTEQLGVDPSPELRELHLRVLRDEVVGPPAPRGNLRAALTSFVGRAEELERIGGHLERARLVTLVGPGGAGKTRLATTAAAATADRVPGGVWLVEFAALGDPADVPQTVLGALEPGVTAFLDTTQPRAPLDATGRLVQVLSAGEVLLVLDNCEHVVDAAARIAEDLLGRCPRLRILATSREPLGIAGEVLFPVRPLGLPGPAAAPADLLASPAVRLFCDRAAAARPGFVAGDAHDAATVAEICRRLDGLPLAIELAAARLRALSLEQLAARLDDRFRLLTGGSRTAMPRHQTLRAVVSWSWDLVTEPERRLAERLAVFSGGITLDGAEGVCGDHAVAGQVLDLLAALVDKSLLQPVGEADGERRYRMLETIREYGLERLADAGAGAVTAARAAHAAHFLRLAETAEPRLRGADQLHWIARLTDERDNLLAALHFACETGDAQTAVRLCAALGMHWTMRGNHADAASWSRRALGVPGPAPAEARVVAAAFLMINEAASGVPRPDASTVDTLRATARAAGAGSTHPMLVLVEPFIAMVTGDAALGRATVERGLRRPDPWARAMLLLLRAYIGENDGDAAGRLRDLTAAAAAFRAIGDRWGLSTALTGLAEVQGPLGDVDGAVATLEESVGLLRSINADDTGPQRVMLAQLRAHRGEVERARADLREVIEAGRSRGPTVSVAAAHLTLGEIARRAGDLDEAARRHAAASACLDGAPVVTPQFRAVLRCATGRLALARGELCAGERLIGEAAAIARETRDMPVRARVGVAVADLWWCRGEPDRAAELLGAAELLRGSVDRIDPDLARLDGELRDSLGDAAFEAAHARGRTLSRADALDRLDHARRR